MAWTTPKTWAALTELTASELNTHLRDNLAYLKARTDAIPFSGAQATRATNQNISTANDTNITLTAQAFDYDGWFAPSSTKIIVPAGAIPAGYTRIAVLVVGYVEYESSSGAGGRWIRLQKNGANFGGISVGGLTDSQGLHLTDFTTCEVGDEFQIETRQTSGGTLAVTYTSLTVVRLGIVE